MANIKLGGQNYYDVDKVVLPTVEGGTEEFSSGGGNNKLPDFIEGSMTAIIPADLQGATELGEYAIYMKSGLLSVSLPSSVQSIGALGISNNPDLEEITVAEGTETLGVECFEYNFSLTTVHLPSTIINEGNNEYLLCFNGCENLSDIYYNSTQADWETIDPNKDLFGSGLEQQITVHCTDGNIIINEPVGNMVVTLTDDTVINISVPAVPLALGIYAEQYEFNVFQTKSVVFPSGVTKISEGFANGCMDLTSVTFPDTLVKIENSAFSYTALSNIDLPDTIEELGNSVFQNLLSSSVSLTCRAVNPPIITYNTLRTTPSTLTAIYVPAGSVTDYQQDTNWSQYSGLIQAIV